MSAHQPFRTVSQTRDGQLVDVPGLAISWFAANARDLPWRNNGCSAWGVLVSEVMLQQTPVSRVIPAWNTWMSTWPQPADLAAATNADVIRAWDRLGYPRRALRLRAAAIVIRDEHGGDVPIEYEQLITLPGVGDYTAAAVAAFAHKQRAVVLDTNVRRVIARVIEGQPMPASSAPTKLERQMAEELLPDRPADAALWSVAVMELGALLCRPTSPACDACPLAQQCLWRQRGFPPAPERKRASQGFEGTDRQVRGRIMAMLRARHDPVALDDLTSTCTDPIQRARALDGLVADGLVEPLAGGNFRLPQ
ncbi:MAG: A/G-specific adenine glycosylase [Candidatus Nanopelagicales bacterium]|nr:A/G-specific adenine glycosylase [Candidatus Nanopelagicales bacterium]